jgi:hypothetical protein
LSEFEALLSNRLPISAVKSMGAAEAYCGDMLPATIKAMARLFCLHRARWRIGLFPFTFLQSRSDECRGLNTKVAQELAQGDFRRGKA